jgi:hypothetical protein
MGIFKKAASVLRKSRHKEQNEALQILCAVL